MTLTDRLSRGTYLLDHGDDRPGVICLSYTWSDDSLKLLPLSPDERLTLMLGSLEEIYPGVDFRSHIVSDPVTLSWETERHFMGAFKANLPGHYRYQERLFSHFVQDELAPGIAGSSSPATTSRGRRDGPRAPSRPRSTRCGES